MVGPVRRRFVGAEFGVLGQLRRAIIPEMGTQAEGVNWDA